MLNVSSNCRIFVYAGVADMRKGIDGLSGLVRAELNADPTDGSLFVFINRRRDRMKVLHFIDGGFWLYYRVLEMGSFEAIKNASNASHITMDTTELAMLLSGVTLAAASRRRNRYSKPNRAA